MPQHNQRNSQSAKNKITRLIHKFFSLSPLQVWALLRQPAMIPVLLNAPRHEHIIVAARAIFPNISDADLERYHNELLRNHQFFQSVNDLYVPKRGRRMQEGGWPELLYILIRVRQPDIFVETGVFDGHSSAHILQAMHDNKKGKLISIDLPAHEAITYSTNRMPESTLPPHCQPGWMIPEYLRDRHELLLGDSATLLPDVFRRNRQIDMFLHDSLHTFAHQWFEYSQAWPVLRAGGLLLSDDVFWNTAFHRFCRTQERKYDTYKGLGVCIK